MADGIVPCKRFPLRNLWPGGKKSLLKQALPFARHATAAQTELSRGTHGLTTRGNRGWWARADPRGGRQQAPSTHK